MSPLLRALRGFRGRIAVAGAAGTGTVAAGVGLLATAAYLIVRAALHPPILDLTVAIVGVRFFGISRAVLRYLERLAAHDAALRVVAALRVRTFRAVRRLGPAGMERRGTGSLLAAITDDLEEIEQALVRSLLPVLVSASILILAGGTAWALAPPVGPAVVAGLALTAAGAATATAATGRAAGRALAPARARFAERLVDLVEGRSEALVYGRADDLVEQAMDADRMLTDLARRTAWLSGIGAGVVMLGSGITLWVVARTAVAAVSGGSLDPILLGAVLLLVLAAFEPVALLPSGLSRLEGGVDAARRTAGLEGSPDRMRGGTGRPGRPSLLLEGAGVSRGGPGGWVFRDVDLRLEPGRRLAIVGPSGTGKSTLIDVLLRFRELDAGEYRIGGRNVAALDPRAVRSLIALADEEAHLLDDTLDTNLRLGRPGARDAEVRQALHAVDLHQLVARLPQGLATRVGPRGAFLSGGERRRVALARALVADRPILVVDEPTAGLDPAAAERAVRRILRAARHRSLLLVTHGPEGLADMDEILVLGEHGVVERGRHRELLAAGGQYARLFGRESDGIPGRPGSP